MVLIVEEAASLRMGQVPTEIGQTILSLFRADLFCLALANPDHLYYISLSDRVLGGTCHTIGHTPAIDHSFLYD